MVVGGGGGGGQDVITIKTSTMTPLSATVSRVLADRAAMRQMTDNADPD